LNDFFLLLILPIFILPIFILTLTFTLVSCGDSVNVEDGGNDDGGNRIYELGDLGPGGGKIFYVNPNADSDGWTYLEAAPNDIGNYAWAPAPYTDTSISTGTAIGTGRENTTKIIAQIGAVNAPAASACHNAIYGGKNDWFLPSRDELKKLYDNMGFVGGFDTNTSYWSSSQAEDYPYSACTVVFSNGNLDSMSKTNTMKVRAIRVF
jgi:hypothetical protein